MSGAKWVTSGDIQIDPQTDPNFNPVTIIPTKDNGYGTLKLVTMDQEGCVGQTLAQKDIVPSYENSIDINSTVCIDPVTKTGAGELLLVDKYELIFGKVVPVNGIDKCVWTVTAGSATLTPDKNNPGLCLVSNASGDFTVSCQPSRGNCTSGKLLLFPITVSNCSSKL